MKNSIRLGLFLLAISAVFFVSVVFQGCSSDGDNVFDEETCAAIAPYFDGQGDLGAVSTEDFYYWMVGDSDAGVAIEDFYEVINSRVRNNEGWEDFHVDVRGFIAHGFPEMDPPCGFDADGNLEKINTSLCAPGFNYYAAVAGDNTIINQEDIDHDGSDDGIFLPEYVFRSFWNIYCNPDGTNNDELERESMLEEFYQREAVRRPGNLGRRGNIRDSALFTDANYATTEVYRIVCDNLRSRSGDRHAINCLLDTNTAEDQQECANRGCPRDALISAMVPADSIGADDEGVDTQEVCGCNTPLQVPAEYEAICLPNSQICPLFAMGDDVEIIVSAYEDEDVELTQWEQEEFTDEEVRSADGELVRAPRRRKRVTKKHATYCSKGRRSARFSRRRRTQRKIRISKAKINRRVKWRTGKNAC